MSTENTDLKISGNFLYAETSFSALVAADADLEGELSSAFKEEQFDLSYLLLPVRSLRNIFAWVSTLERLGSIGLNLGEEMVLHKNQALVASSCSCTNDGLLNLEEYCFIPQAKHPIDGVIKELSAQILPDSEEYEWWRKKLENDLVLVSEESFSDLLLAVSLEEGIEKDIAVTATQSQALLNFPRESLLHVKSDLPDTKEVFQLGALKSLGRGMFRVISR